MHWYDIRNAGLEHLATVCARDPVAALGMAVGSGESLEGLHRGYYGATARLRGGLVLAALEVPMPPGSWAVCVGRP
jgi:hypothetical protein